jgi:DHA1 family bicyclomycin/chloramphenicol resistance-like MFS transporter
VACLFAAAQLPETLPPTRRTDHGIAAATRAYARLIKDSRFLAPALLIGFTYVTLFSFISTSPAVFIDYFGLNELQFAILFGALSLCFALGAPLNRRLLKRFSMQQISKGAVVLQVVASSVMLTSALVAPGLVIATTMVGLAMLTVGMVSANGTALALDPFPSSAGSAAALVGVFGMVVGAGVSSLLVVIHLPVVTELGSAMALGAFGGVVMLPFISERRRIARAAREEPVND